MTSGEGNHVRRLPNFPGEFFTRRVEQFPGRCDLAAGQADNIWLVLPVICEVNQLAHVEWPP
jgi:hypothetical protein